MNKKLIQSCFDKSANTYDSVADVQKASSLDLVKLINFKEVSSVIDIGCGTGNTSLALYEKYPDAEYTLCDISEKMLAVAVEKFPCKVNTSCCDAENYEFPRRYDLAISNLSMQWFCSPCDFIRRTGKIFKSFAFSILTNSSFKKYREYFEIPPVFDYPSVEQLTQITGKRYTLKKYNVEFENFFELTRYFIRLGAYAKFSNATRLRPNNENKIILDYEVFFCVM